MLSALDDNLGVLHDAFYSTQYSAHTPDQRCNITAHQGFTQVDDQVTNASSTLARTEICTQVLLK